MSSSLDINELHTLSSRAFLVDCCRCAYLSWLRYRIALVIPKAAADVYITHTEYEVRAVEQRTQVEHHENLQICDVFQT